MKSIRIIILLLSHLVLLPGFITLQAQVSGSVNYSMFYTDNPFRLTDGTEEYINTYLANLGYQPFQNKLKMSYSFGLNDFRNFTDRSYNYHSFDLNYSFRFLDTTKEENISLEASYYLKQNNSGDELYKYNAYTFAANARFYLMDNLLFVSGYKFGNKNYPSLYNLNYTDNTGYSRLSMFFDTNTAFHFELQLGDRNYSIEETNTLTSGHGKGGRMNRIENTRTTNVTQMLTTLKVSQSLFENTGINIYYLNRNNVNKNSNISLTEFLYSDDNDLWDDPYSFEGNDIGSEFFQILPWDMSLRFSGQYSYRRYKENIADTLSLASQRIDGRTELWLGITKEFYTIPLFNSLELGLEYMHVINNSNENLFTYKNNLILFRLGLNF